MNAPYDGGLRPRSAEAQPRFANGWPETVLDRCGMAKRPLRRPFIGTVLALPVRSSPGVETNAAGAGLATAPPAPTVRKSGPVPREGRILHGARVQTGALRAELA